MPKLDYVLLELVESASRNYKTHPLNLGGSTGGAGGVGGPPGGFIGQLPQNRVTFDSDEAAYSGYPYSGVSLVDNLNHIRYRLGVLESGGSLLIVDDNTPASYSDTTELHFSGAGVVVTSPSAGKVVATIAATGSGGASSFLDLTDSPDSYTGQAGKVLAVNGTETGLQFITASGAGVPLIVQEYDGLPVVTNVDKLIFSGATVTDLGDGDVLITISGVGGSGSGLSWVQTVNESGASFTNWTGISGSWSSDGSVIKQTATDATVRRAKYNTIQPTSHIIYQAEIQIKTSGADRRGGLVFFDGSAAGGTNVYLDEGNNKVYIERDGVIAITSWTSTINIDTWYTLKLVKTGSVVDIYLDDVFIGTGEDSSYRNISYIGLYTYQSEVWYRNIKTWELSSSQTGGGGTIVVEEFDGNPSISGVDKIIFSGATVTDLGNGDALVTISGGGLSDAPSDGSAYVRKNSAWSPIVSGIIVEDSDGSPSISGVDKIVFSGATVVDNGNGDALVAFQGLTDAPSNGYPFGRMDGAWTNLKNYNDSLYLDLSYGTNHDHSGGDGGTVAYTALSGRPVAETNANDIFRCDNPGGTSAFVGTINGTPSGTSVVYNVTSGQEGAMVPTSTSQLAKMRLYNTTRSNSALISNCNTTTNTITLTATAPANWANGDTITIASQTVSGGGVDWVDLEITSGLTNKTYIFIDGLINTTASNDGLFFHPFETYGAAKTALIRTQTANVTISKLFLYKATTNIVTAGWLGTPSVVILREAGYLE